MNFKQFLKESKESYHGEHEAPTKNDAPLYDMTKNGIYPSDFYETIHQYVHDEYDRECMSIVSKYKNKPNRSIVVYRAVPLTNSQELEAKLKDYNDAISHIQKTGKIPTTIKKWEKYKNFENKSDCYNFLADEIPKIEKELENVPSERLKINKGDWVTLSKKYAEHHGKSHLNNKYKILSKTVYVKELFTDGNSLSEWGYNP